MKNFIYSLMTDKKNGLIAQPIKIILYMLSLLYGAAILLRRIFYKFGVFKAARAPLPVISVGNITLGGTGKTPFVIALAGILKNDMAKDPAVLIRGYGWDEQAMLKRSLPDIPILVGEDRARSCRRAIKLYGSDAAILDDGFQHWELARDLDIVLIDLRVPFGNGRLFPRGVLREPKSALKRADIVVFTKADKAAFDAASIKRQIESCRPGMLFLEARHLAKYFYDLRMNREFGLEHVKDKRVILLSSIGDPSYFEETVRGLGADILAHIAFGDHHNYVKRDIDRIARICGERKFDMIVTTEKDAVKLRRLGFAVKGHALVVLSVDMDIFKGKEDLVARLHSVFDGQAAK